MTRDDGARIASIDILRGLVMALMALDHTRDFFGEGGLQSPRCNRPGAVPDKMGHPFLRANVHLSRRTSAFLYGRGRSVAETSRFLFIRGLWLIVIEFTVVRLAWTFDLDFTHAFTAGVIWVIGTSMVALSALVWLPRWAIAAVALIMIAGHNLLDGVRAEDLGEGAAVWHVLHQPGSAQLGDGVQRLRSLSAHPVDRCDGRRLPARPGDAAGAG